MARKKISEFRAKQLAYDVLGVEYGGISIGSEDDPQEILNQVQDDGLYVVKVDQGVKKRGKQGLVKIKVQKSEIKDEIEELRQKGFENFLVEEFVPHESSDEKYLAMSRVREGIEVYYSEKGGVDIEENAEKIQKFIMPWSEDDIDRFKTREHVEWLELKLHIASETLQKLIFAFEHYCFSFMELNPFMIHNSEFIILDAAVEVDSAAEFFVKGAWTRNDFRDYSVRPKTQEEKNVIALAETSQASFSLTVLNPDGAIWMLLSGGGASIVLADEAYNQKFGKEVGNYGEYSGNPNEEETYYYTKQVLNLLLKSSSDKKVLIVGGGVANFTDVAKTFKGVIRAIDEVAEKLRSENVKVYVRRGGPNQEVGLANMKKFLEEKDLYGLVAGPEIVLTEVMREAIEELN